MSSVLVTGGSGFVGIHVVIALLKAGHDVRTTIRQPDREAGVRTMLDVAGVDPGDRLSFRIADLQSDAGWAEAVAGCDYVLHVASPFPPRAPAHEDELIVPARDGTLRVLRAARDGGVRRVVVTSSFAAVGSGRDHGDAPVDEASWTDADSPNINAYVKSKTLAERAAWDFIEREGGELELAVVNPVWIFGPAYGRDLSSSVLLIKNLIEGRPSGSPRTHLSVVDVRDLADLHLRAMTDPAARGERFLAVSGEPMALVDMAKLLGRETVPPAAGAIPHPVATKARERLGWSPRPPEESILATADSLARLGIL